MTELTMEETETEPATGDETEEEEEGSDQGGEETDEPEALAGGADEEVPHAGPLSDDEQLAVFDKAIKRAKVYMRAVPDILGASGADLELCPRCTDLLPGFILPSHIKPVTDEQKVAVKLSIGELANPEYPAATDAERCSSCNGLGKVSSGSAVPNQAVLRCERCMGRGWVGARADRAASSPEPLAVAPAVTDDGSLEPKPVIDPWGRSIDDPLWGVMPGFERD